MATRHQPAAAIDLSSTQERPLIRIDRIDYDVRVLDDFTPHELRQLDRLLPRVVPLVKTLEAKTLGDEDCRDLMAILSTLLPLVLVAPLEIIDRLGDIDKIRVFQAFYVALAEASAAQRVPEGSADAEPLTWDKAVARLQRFYAGDLADWSASVPIGLSNRLLAQIPKLEAEESLQTATRIAIGSGLGESSTRDRVWSDWQREANAGRQTIAKRPSEAEMRAMGIGVRKIAKKKPAVITGHSEESATHAARA